MFFSNTAPLRDDRRPPAAEIRNRKLFFSVICLREQPYEGHGPAVSMSIEARNGLFSVPFSKRMTIWVSSSQACGTCAHMWVSVKNVSEAGKRERGARLAPGPSRTEGFENAFFENAFFEKFANFWRARFNPAAPRCTHGGRRRASRPARRRPPRPPTAPPGRARRVCAP